MGSMPSVSLCTLAWHSTRAGASGVEDLAMDPSQHHHAEHLRKALGARSLSSFYWGRVAIWDYQEEERKMIDFPINAPHDQFASAYLERPTDFQVAAHDDPQLSPLYFRHSVYQRVGHLAAPIGYFSDGVPHSKKDSFFAFYWSNGLTGQRFLICSLRKSDLCKCGCKGFCTLGAVLRMIAWSFNVVAEGVYPAMRHDGKPFADEVRAAQRGEPIADGYCGALVEMRADLEEFSNSCGFKRSTAVDRPCFCCKCSRETLFDFPANIESSLWEKVDGEAYDAQVRQHIRKCWVTTTAELEALVGALGVDGRANAPAGLVTRAAYPPLNLPRGARLLEFGELVDIHDVASLEVPVELFFFDTQGDSGLNFVCPLFEVEGFSIEALHLDVMHCMDLGITQLLIGKIFMTLVKNNFAKSLAPHAEVRLSDNMKFLRKRIRKYYGEQSRSRREMNAIGRLTYPMLSKPALPKLKAKAAETRNLLPLCPLICRENMGCLGERAEYLVAAADELVKVYEVMQDEPRRMTPDGLRALRQAMTRHLSFWQHAGGHLVPKHHYSWHLVERAGEAGNPRWYWCYADEGENRTMSRVAGSLHAGDTFYATFLQKVLPYAAGR